MELISYADSSEQEWISMPGDAFSSSTIDSQNHNMLFSHTICISDHHKPSKRIDKSISIDLQNA